jgi:hypothetical protein
MGARLTNTEKSVYAQAVKEGLTRQDNSLRIVWVLRTEYGQTRHDTHAQVMIVRRMMREFQDV